MSTMVKMLEEAYLTLNNAVNDPEIVAILARVGYGSESLQEGLALYGAASQLIQTENDTRFNKVSTTATFKQTLAETQLQYHHDRRSARLTLKQWGTSQQFLQLGESRTNAYDSWFKQATGFYQGLANKPELQATVARMGLTLERINQGLLSLQTLKALRSQILSDTATVTNAQEERNDTLQTFEQWMFTFRGIARFALAAHPGHLKMLGLKAVASKVKKQNATRVEKNHSIDLATLLNVAA